jgi:sarcosine oxidase subunit beta
MAMKAYDAVVIGAGAIGSSTAYYLCKEGMSVALVDRGDVASGSSSHCDAVGLISDKKPGIDTRMGQASIDLYAGLAREFSYDFEFNPKGCVFACETEAEMEAAGAYVARQRADGYDMRLLDPRELRDLEPRIAGDLAGGTYTPGEGAIAVCPYKVCFAFVEEARALGGLDVYTYCEARAVRLSPGAGRVEAVETDAGAFATGVCVNCGGAWAPQVGRLVGIDIPIQPRKGMNLVSEKTEQLCFHKVLEFGYMMSKFDDISFRRDVSPLVEEYNVAFNLEYTNANNLLLGGYRGFRGFDVRSEAEAVKAIAERGIRFYPDLAGINCIRSYAGVRPFVRDHLPIVSGVDSVPGFYIAAGHEGDGICFAPFTGKAMAQIVAGRPTDFDLSNLAFSRFASGAAAEGAPEGAAPAAAP